MDERGQRAAFIMPLPFPLRFEGRWQVVLKRAHFRNALSMQLELDFSDGGGHVRHVRRLPRAPCESPFGVLDQIWHTNVVVRGGTPTWWYTNVVVPYLYCHF